MKKLLLIASLTSTTTAFAMLPSPPATQLTPLNTAPPALSTPTTINAPPAQHDIGQAMFAYLVHTTHAGQEQLVPITQATPINRGDIVEYQAYLSNKSPNRIRSMAVIMTVNSDVELISIDPNNAFASTDGTHFSRVSPHSTTPLSQYRAIRWVVEDVDIGTSAVLKYRAKVK